MEREESSAFKVKKICDILRNEALEPAQKEAHAIVASAQNEARELIRQAEEKKGRLLEEAKAAIEKERELFQGALREACKQALEGLRQEIEKSLLNPQLDAWVKTISQDPQVGATFIETLVQAIKQEGTSADFSAVIAKTALAEKINAALAKETLEHLREKSVVVGDFAGGIQIKLHDKKITLDMSDAALRDLLGRYLRKDFRTILFNS